jgi:hypothetical protein
MRIEIVGDDSFARQARTYAEYRLFATLSRVVDTRRVRSAALMLRRAKGQDGGVVCTVTIELDDAGVTRLRSYGGHPYAAINGAIERLQLNAWPVSTAAGGSDDRCAR